MKTYTTANLRSLPNGTILGFADQHPSLGISMFILGRMAPYGALTLTEVNSETMCAGLVYLLDHHLEDCKFVIVPDGTVCTVSQPEELDEKQSNKGI